MISIENSPECDTNHDITLRGPDLAIASQWSAAQPLPPLDLPPRDDDQNPQRLRRGARLADNPETVLVALMDECHYLMSEVALRCIVQSPGVEDRLAFMKSAKSFAETGAKVAKALAVLRTAPLGPDRRAAILLEGERRLREAREKAES